MNENQVTFNKRSGSVAFFEDKAATSWILILSDVITKAKSGSTKAKSGSTLSRVGARKVIRPMAINKPAI